MSINNVLFKANYLFENYFYFQLYGGTYATRMLSSFAKLFMSFLQYEGFTLGVHDILTVKRADSKRKKLIKESRKIGIQAVASALGISLETEMEEIVEKIEQANTTNPKFRAILDRQYKTMLDTYTNNINKWGGLQMKSFFMHWEKNFRACLPAGLVCKFPANNLQLMVQSGAKGSMVNTMQISCLLGQIELEGTLDCITDY